MRSFNGIDEIEAAVGEDLGASEWHTITQEQIDAFADATGDHQWIHVDVERAEAGPFGGTIAHGYLTLSLAPLFIAEALVIGAEQPDGAYWMPLFVVLAEGVELDDAL